VLGLDEADKRQWISVGGNLMSFELPWLLWREPNLQIIHSHALGRLGGIGLTIAKRRRLPFVVTVHGGVLAIPDSLKESFSTRSTGLEWGRLFGVLLNARRVFADAAAILTCNEKEAELLRHQYPDKRIQVQPHGVPLQQFGVNHREAALSEFPELRNKRILLVPGRIDPIKNQAWVVEQARSVLHRYPDAVLVLVGACTDKEYGVRIDALISNSPCSRQILRTGGLPSGDPRLLGLFQQAAAVVLPSRSETFGLVVLESWAAGAPVIASRTPGASALVRHGENGWLFDLDAPHTFHDAVQNVLSNPKHGRQLACAGHELVAREYDSSVLAARLKDLYTELCQARVNVALRRPLYRRSLSKTAASRLSGG
jgi:glycosyltransferase involved in cell wall biosynthesis